MYQENIVRIKNNNNNKISELNKELDNERTLRENL